MADDVPYDHEVINPAEDLSMVDLTAEVHSFHPLYLHPSENPNQSVVSIKLQGSQNYVKWSRALQILLLGKNKLGFVTGSCKRDSFDQKLRHLWDRCNAVVLGWLINSVSADISDGIMYCPSAFLAWRDLHERFNKINGSRIYQLHREIVSTKQSLDSISTYFTKLRNLWTEYDTICALPHIDGDDFKKHVEHQNNQRLFQFLMGLNENFSNVRSSLLLWTPLPNLNVAYSMLLQEENQRDLSASIVT